MSKKTVVIDEFDAVYAEGNTYRIRCMQDIIESRLLDGTITRNNGMMSFMCNNRGVNKIDDNIYEIVQLGKCVTKQS